MLFKGFKKLKYSKRYGSFVSFETGKRGKNGKKRKEIEQKKKNEDYTSSIVWWEMRGEREGWSTYVLKY
jgi:hypothetical protein